MFDKKLWRSRTSKGVLLHTLQLVVRDDQGGQSGQVCEHVGWQHGHLVVAQVQPGQGLEVLEPVALYGGDLVDVEVELRGLGRDALGDLCELGVGASDDGSSAAARWWAVVGTQATHVVPVWNKQNYHNIVFTI